MLLTVIRNAVLETAQRIDTLDILGHGSSGHQYLGAEVLFNVENGVLAKGQGIARGLRRFLTPDARMRLLGCWNATGESGRALLLGLREEIGESVVVYGAISDLNAREKPPNGGIEDGEFDERGFKDLKECDWLFSSTEARRRLAPTHGARVAENQAWMTGIRES